MTVDKSIFCSSPWQRLFIDTNGDVKTCCAGQSVLGNIRKDNINDIINSNTASRIKHNIHAGNWDEANCFVCKHVEQNGGESERQSFQYKSIKKYIKDNIDFFEPNYLDIRWNNTCNLTCSYCGPKFSSAWEKVQKNTADEEKEEKFINAFNEYLSQNMKKVFKIWLFGGEPLLMKENVGLLKNLPDNKKFIVSTNLSIPDLEKSSVWREISKKTNVDYLISFENVGDKFEYVRYKADWNIFNKNLDILLAHSKTVYVAATYNIFSATDLVDLYTFAKQKQIKLEWSLLVNPKELDIFNFPIQYRQKAFNEIEEVISKFSDYDIESINQLKKIQIKLLENTNKSFNVEMFKKFIQKQEKLFSKKKTFDELWNNFYM